MSMFHELMMRKKGIPERYQEVEYIESTGTQYIDTGIYLTGDSRVKIKFQLTNTTYKGERIFGSQFPNETFRFGTGGDFTWRVGYWDSTSVSLSTPSPALNVLYEIDFNKTEFYLNNNLIHTFTKKDFTATHTAYLFNVHYTNNMDFVVAKVYYCQIYDNNRLVRNFIPVYDTETQKYGMWESVQGKFYGNDGTGDFKGSIVGYTIVGSPTITDGVVSGFSSSNYLQISNFPAYTQDDRVELVFNFTLTTLTDSTFMGGNGALFVSVVNSSGKIQYYGSAIGLSGELGANILSTGQNYYFKVIYDTNSLKGYISTDGTIWILDYTKNLSATFSKSGVYYIGRAPVANQYLRGTMNLNNTYIKVNNKLVFNGQPS
ncbi:MAG: hypothetical protein J6S85_10025 [Methanobrevibacter sp.]|nr:hypothetical protein [Methanobrevibacter sp.]